jgi:predicted metal-dependent enzyme (double-stranded beta helix superfamily)
MPEDPKATVPASTATVAPDGPYGDIATRVVYEDERLRIWELVLEPGEEGPLHKHELDHILVQIAGDKMAVVPHPDSKSRYGEYLEAEVFPGQIFVIERGGIEIARNVGREPYKEILIELKD